MSGKESIVRLLGSIFIVDPMLGSPRKLSQRLRERCTSFEPLSDLSPLPIDTPSDAPAEAPRAFLTEPSQTWQFICTAQRTNVVYFPQKEEDPQSALTTCAFWELCAGLLASVQKELSLDVNRVSGVSHVRADIDERGVNRVKNLFFSSALPDFFDEREHSAEWHVNNRVGWQSGLQDCFLNRITRVKAVRASGEPENANVLFVETDINTIPDNPDVRFAEEEVQQFFRGIEQTNRKIREALHEIGLFT